MARRGGGGGAKRSERSDSVGVFVNDERLEGGAGRTTAGLGRVGDIDPGDTDVGDCDSGCCLSVAAAEVSLRGEMGAMGEIGEVGEGE